MKKIFAALAAGALALSLTACGGKADDSTLKVGASPTPHAKILQYVKDNLAKEAGLNLEIVEFSDYIKPNEALAGGDLDANYFQTVPYLETQQAGNSAYENFVPGSGIHLEPLGVYSSKISNLKDLKDGDLIGIIDDPTNQVRALTLLAGQGIIKLPSNEAEHNVAAIEGSAEYNPHGYKFQVAEGTKLVRALDDVQIGVINGNYAQEGGLAPVDAIALESVENNPAANILVWSKDTKKLDAVKKLDELLHSDEVKAYIEKTWADKSVIPAF